MDLLTLGILGFVGYQLLKPGDDRPTKLRQAAQGMLAQATSLEQAGQQAASVQLRNHAQALLAQAAGIESGRIK
jgi:hypothetical protein